MLLAASAVQARVLLPFALLLASSAPHACPSHAAGCPAEPRQLLPTGMRQRAAELTAWAQHRQTEVLPRLMVEYGVLAWVVTAVEYNEDPAIWAIWPAWGLRDCVDDGAMVDTNSTACLAMGGRAIQTPLSIFHRQFFIQKKTSGV